MTESTIAVLEVYFCVVAVRNTLLNLVNLFDLYYFVVHNSGNISF